MSRSHPEKFFGKNILKTLRGTTACRGTPFARHWLKKVEWELLNSSHFIRSPFSFIIYNKYQIKDSFMFFRLTYNWRATLSDSNLIQQNVQWTLTTIVSLHAAIFIRNQVFGFWVAFLSFVMMSMIPELMCDDAENGEAEKANSKQEISSSSTFMLFISFLLLLLRGLSDLSSMSHFSKTWILGTSTRENIKGDRNALQLTSFHYIHLIFGVSLSRE